MTLEGFAPDSTGACHAWRVTTDQLERIITLLQEIRQAQYWGDAKTIENAKDQLQSMPGFPKGEPGDHWVIERRRANA